ncbi:MAG: 3-hydroxyacyl-CoA dehydrogenase NAD-binding domain-containing protein, partial [Solirubrobacteraceae bacterium]
MDTVGIVGAGQMGSGIAEVVAVAGLRTIVHEPELAPLRASEARV